MLVEIKLLGKFITSEPDFGVCRKWQIKTSIFFGHLYNSRYMPIANMTCQVNFFLWEQKGEWSYHYRVLPTFHFLVIVNDCHEM